MCLAGIVSFFFAGSLWVGFGWLVEVVCWALVSLMQSWFGRVWCSWCPSWRQIVAFFFSRHDFFTEYENVVAVCFAAPFYPSVRMIAHTTFYLVLVAWCCAVGLFY